MEDDAMAQMKVTAESRRIKQWITVNGKHIPIFEGETKEDAVKRATNKKVAEDGVKVAKSFQSKYSNQIDKDNDTKEKQIRQNAIEAEAGYGKDSDVEKSARMRRRRIDEDTFKRRRGEVDSDRLKDSSDYRTRSAEAALEAAKKHTGDKSLTMHKMDDGSYVIVGKNGSRAGIVKPEKSGTYTLNVRNKSMRSRDELQSNRKNDIKLSEYEYVANRNGYQTYRKIVNGKGVWVAQDQDKKYPPFPITYNQALGHDPIITEHSSNAERLGYEVGQMLFNQKKKKK